MRVLPQNLIASATPQQVASARKTAQQFEGMVLGQMLQPMFATTDFSKNSFFGGAAESTWQPMMVDEISKGIAKSGGLGIAEPVFQEILRLQVGTADGTGDAPPPAGTTNNAATAIRAAESAAAGYTASSAAATTRIPGATR